MEGRDKLLETINGEAILARTARIAVEAGLGPVLVGMRPNDTARRMTLERLDITCVDVPNADLGMSATLRAGAAAAVAIISAHNEADYEYSGMMIILPDMPGIAASDLQKMDAAFQASGGACVRATDSSGKYGHPTMFPLHVLRDFEALNGDKGAASMFEAERVKTIALGDRACLDLDTPQDWFKWRAKTGVES